MRTVYLSGVAILVGLGVAAAITNPSEAAYSDYATLKLSSYLKQEVCAELPEKLGQLITSQIPELEAECVKFIETDQTQLLLQETIADSTERRDFVIFSLYETDLSVKKFVDRLIPVSLLKFNVPSYTVSTVGVFRSFYIYRVEK